MTRQEFYQKLREIAPEFRWEVDDKGGIRGYINKSMYCPITAVCRAECGEYYSTPWFQNAGNTLGLSVEDTNIISRNADSNTGNAFIRKTLLESVGLQKGG